MSDPTPKLRWYQFSLRTLLIFVTLCAVACSWLAVNLRDGKRKWEAVLAIRDLKGEVFSCYEYDPDISIDFPIQPDWVRECLGSDLPLVDTVDASSVPISKSLFLRLAAFPHLKGLLLCDVHATDHDIAFLEPFVELKSLDLGTNDITDAGVTQLTRLVRLQRLSLFANHAISDSSLSHLEGLRELKELDLRATKVTDEGVKKLQRALPKCMIKR
jgi:hypothetical protein